MSAGLRDNDFAVLVQHRVTERAGRILMRLFIPNMHKAG